MLCLSVKLVSPFTIFGIIKDENQRIQKKFPLFVRTFEREKSTGKNLCQCGTKYISNNSAQLGQNFQNRLPDNLARSLKQTSVQRGQKYEIQLRHNLCTS